MAPTTFVFRPEIFERLRYIFIREQIEGSAPSAGYMDRVVSAQINVPQFQRCFKFCDGLGSDKNPLLTRSLGSNDFSKCGSLYGSNTTLPPFGLAKSTSTSRSVRCQYGCVTSDSPECCVGTADNEQYLHFFSSNANAFCSMLFANLGVSSWLCACDACCRAARARSKGMSCSLKKASV